MTPNFSQQPRVIIDPNFKEEELYAFIGEVHISLGGKEGHFLNIFLFFPHFLLIQN